MAKQVVQEGIHNYTEIQNYVAPKGKEVQEHLNWFMGLKLGLMMHWGPECQFGTYESWPLSDEDASWSQSEIDWTDISTFKEQYINSNRTFNPVKFRPDKWAKLAKECGFKYLLFTTKHHDGFCMFDTKTTNYKITDPSCPFHTHPYADIVGSLYKEFRKEGLAISTYFSKPDWHCDYYWHRAFDHCGVGTGKTRNVNYSIAEHPDLWEKFVQYTHTQIEELCSNYGNIDVLWLDGGWVNPNCAGQDIRLSELIPRLREKLPHLIVTDRTAGGEYENFVTPEKTVPETALSIPWETCATLGERFAFLYTDHFKTGHELVHLLLDIVSKGGNLALNIAPQPDGALPKPAVKSLKELGHWLSIFGEGIYETHIQKPYFDENLKYMAKENAVYVFYLYDEQEPKLPLSLSFVVEHPIQTIKSIRNGYVFPFAQTENTVTIDTRYFPISGGFFAEGFLLL